MEISARLAVALVLVCLHVPAAATEATQSGRPAGLRVEPDSIPIGMTFNGATVKLSAEVPAGYEAAIRVMGKDQNLEMKQKGKVGRALWMSVGEVTFQAVPAVYFLLTSRPLANPALAATLGEWRLGYEALASAAGSARHIYPELIKLKEKEGRFRVGEGQLVRSASTGNGSMDRLTGSFRLPARAPAGEYAVDLFGFHEERAVHLGSTRIRLEHTGLARVLRFVAAEHGLTYGGVAVVVAVLAGLTTGFVFRPRKGKAR